jgi:hypothetical protein
MVEYVEKFTAERKDLIRALKDRPCFDCGEQFHFMAMEFDHVRGEKLHEVGRMVYRSLGAIVAEAAKCDVVCANCHRVRTWKRAGEEAE